MVPLYGWGPKAERLVGSVSCGHWKRTDNLSAHKGERVRKLIEASGGEVLYLPPYSPDLNPIEQAFSKLKHWLRAAQETTTQNLWDMIGTILDHFKTDECARYFQNSGYRAE